jgi:large subunit ribosomal protein L11e
MRYDTSTGIFGMDFCVVLKRPGDRVSKRRSRKSRLGNFHKISKAEAQLWFIEQLGGTILN